MTLSLKQRVVLRFLGVKVSDDGARWTASRKHAEIIERAFARVVDEAWRDGTDVRLSYDPGGGMTIHGLEKKIALRWLP